jgi:hypothetical protein
MRARIIRPSFFANDELAELSPHARLFFIGLWCAADAKGRLEDKPKKLKVKLLPYDDVNVDDLITELAARGFVVRFTWDGKPYLFIPNFKKHQKPHYEEKCLEVKDPSEVSEPPEAPRRPRGKPRAKPRVEPEKPQAEPRAQPASDLNSDLNSNLNSNFNFEKPPNPLSGACPPQEGGSGEIVLHVRNLVDALSGEAADKFIAAPTDKTTYKRVQKNLAELNGKVSRQDLSLLAQWVGSGALDFMGPITLRYFATPGNISDGIGKAKAWEARGRAPPPKAKHEKPRRYEHTGKEDYSDTKI